MIEDEMERNETRSDRKPMGYRENDGRIPLFKNDSKPSGGIAAGEGIVTQDRPVPGPAEEDESQEAGPEGFPAVEGAGSHGRFRKANAEHRTLNIE